MGRLETPESKEKELHCHLSGVEEQEPLMAVSAVLAPAAVAVAVVVTVVMAPVLVVGTMVMLELVGAVEKVVEEVALYDCYYFCWHQRGLECKGGP